MSQSKRLQQHKEMTIMGNIFCFEGPILAPGTSYPPGESASEPRFVLPRQTFLGTSLPQRKEPTPNQEIKITEETKGKHAKQEKVQSNDKIIEILLTQICSSNRLVQLCISFSSAISKPTLVTAYHSTLKIFEISSDKTIVILIYSQDANEPGSMKILEEIEGQD